MFVIKYINKFWMRLRKVFIIIIIIIIVIIIII